MVTEERGGREYGQNILYEVNYQNINKILKN